MKTYINDAIIGNKEVKVGITEKRRNCENSLSEYRL